MLVKAFFIKQRPEKNGHLKALQRGLPNRPPFLLLKRLKLQIQQSYGLLLRKHRQIPTQHHNNTSNLQLRSEHGSSFMPLALSRSLPTLKTIRRIRHILLRWDVSKRTFLRRRLLPNNAFPNIKTLQFSTDRDSAQKIPAAMTNKCLLLYLPSMKSTSRSATLRYASRPRLKLRVSRLSARVYLSIAS